MRLLGYWIVFATLLVVFVPALSLVYSPPAYMSTTSECPLCPKCPKYTFHLARATKTGVTYYPHTRVVQVSFIVEYTPPPRNHVYLLLASVPAYVTGFSAEFCVWIEVPGWGPDGICWQQSFTRLNETHVYTTLYGHIEPIDNIIYIDLDVRFPADKNIFDEAGKIHLDIYLAKEFGFLEDFT